MTNKYKVIGIMSGTSLDGLDIACCEFVYKGSFGDKDNKFAKANSPFDPTTNTGSVFQRGEWKYKITHAETKKYSEKWKKKLDNVFGVPRVNRDSSLGLTKRTHSLPVSVQPGVSYEIEKNHDLKQLDREYGRFIGKEILKFIKRKKIVADLISSHGHTVFHQPENKITLQLGHGQEIASVCRLPVVCDFRSLDVALSGQGAPLVPIADKIFFSQYAFCLNLGGFANISFDNTQQKRVAFDICPVNIVLNGLSSILGKEFDRGGRIASQGEIHDELLKKLNSLSFYKLKPPKSLGREWVEKMFLPVLHAFNISVQDKLRTVVEHFAIQIASVINLNTGTCKLKLLVTGGSTYNDFLMGRIAVHSHCKMVVPDNKTIQFKEAMAFAFLGTLRMRGEVNILKSVTGAKRNSSAGSIYLPA